MSADAYTPRAGSAADLALQHLRLHGTTPEHVLADAIDKELDELQPLLQHAVRCGALHRHRADVGWAWSLGAADHPDAGGAPRQTVVPAASCAPPETSAPRSVFEVPVFLAPDSTDTTERAVAPPATDEAAQVGEAQRGGTTPNDGAAHSETRFALWSDGVLEIQHGAERVGLSQDTTRRLFAYLDRMREGA